MCELTYGDEAGDSASAAIYFVGQTAPAATDLLRDDHVRASRHRGNGIQRTARGDRWSNPDRWKKIAGALPRGIRVNRKGAPVGNAVGQGRFTPLHVHGAGDDAHVQGDHADERYRGADT